MSLIRVGLAWVFFGAGDLWERATYHNLQNWFEWPYRVYQWLMSVSDTLQGEDPRGPWGPISPEQSRDQ